MVSENEFMEIVVQLSRNDPTITVLDLSKSDIGATKLGYLAEALRENTKLKDLDLSHNQVGNWDARHALASFASALKNNTTLTRLCISGNKDHLTDESARALASLLKENNTLTDLNINYNSIGDEGACDFATALKENTTLKKLNLWCNVIGDKGALALTHAVRDSNYTITSLNLDRNEKIQSKDIRIDLDNWLERNKDKEFANKMKEEHKRNAEKQNTDAAARQKSEEAIAPTECTIMISFNDYSAGEDAEKLANYLTSNGHPTFCTNLYCPNMTGDWREVTVKGVVSCKYYVMLLTNGWQKSTECQHETKTAMNRWANEKLIPIPVWYEDFDKDLDENEKNYAIQFQSIQSVQRRSATWMETILKQLGGRN